MKRLRLRDEPVPYVVLLSADRHREKGQSVSDREGVDERGKAKDGPLRRRKG